MTEIRKARRSRGFKFRSTFVIAGLAVLGLVMGNGTAAAGVDNSNFIVDGSGNTITAIQADTFIHAIPPLDGNPLTREWFHNGVAGFTAEGPGAAAFAGSIALGYAVAYPASLTGELTFAYSTPQLELDIAPAGTTAVITDILPQLGASLTVGPGPGIVDVTSATGAIKGTAGAIRISGFHGTVTGVLGNVRIRPFVTVTSSAGDSVTTYGSVWTLN